MNKLMTRPVPIAVDELRMMDASQIAASIFPDANVLSDDTFLIATRRRVNGRLMFTTTMITDEAYEQAADDLGGIAVKMGLESLRRAKSNGTPTR